MQAHPVPRLSSAPSCHRPSRLRGLDRLGLVFDLLGVVLRDGGLTAGRDLDATWLQRLGHLAHQVNGEQSVLQAGALYLDVVGKVEGLLEGSGCDAAVE